jgi:pimeloyl-ACP methyl ester carboxylesterase
MKELRNARVSLALHTLGSTAPALRGGASSQPAEGMPLLLLHALGGSADDFRAAPPAWPGPIYALDFSGHGHSGRVHGGGYYPELWASDADLALAALGEVVVLGVGLGAYVALLLTGGRPEQVRCAVLCAGAGLDGGGTEPDPSQPLLELVTRPPSRELQTSPSTDPGLLAGQDFSIRPPDYALRFALLARRIVLIEDGAARPPWWCALRDAANTLGCADASAGLEHARQA